MKRTAAIATLMVASAGSVGTGALVPELRGSDTLEHLTQLVVANCVGTTGLAYIGGGSGNGENALISGEQLIAPMSRAMNPASGTGLNTGACGVDDQMAGSPAEAEGLTVALDGIAIMASASTAAQCDSDANGQAELAYTNAKIIPVNTTLGDGTCNDCDASNNYVIGGSVPWRDVARVLWAGMHHNGGNTAANQNCDSSVRFTLANTFASLFESSCGAGCSQVSHLFRRGDLSGTTDTFIALLGLPAIVTSGTPPNVSVTSTPFCNGRDTEDRDPIRRACAAGDHVCQARNDPATPFDDRGTTGLLLPVFVPEALPTATAYPTTPCAFGVFRYRPASFAAQAAGRCASGAALSGGQCQIPFTADPSAGGNPACRNPQFNCPGSLPFGTDCRVFNLEVRNANSAGALVLDEENRQVTYAYYRLRSTDAAGSATTQGTAVCQESSATAQIGCLSKTVACSLGFAGREAVSASIGAVPLEVNNTELTVDNVRLLLTSPSTAYPLARRLWVNTMVGFENIVGARTTFSGVDAPNDDWDEEQRTLAECFANQAFVDPFVEQAGFVTLGRPIECVSFPESRCSGFATDTDSCTDNGF